MEAGGRALVTGSSRGIGRAVALDLARAGRAAYELQSGHLRPTPAAGLIRSPDDVIAGLSTASGRR